MNPILNRELKSANINKWYEPSQATSYVSGRERDIVRIRELYKKYGAVEYSKTDNWICIGGYTFNGFTQSETKRILNIEE